MPKLLPFLKKYNQLIKLDYSILKNWNAFLVIFLYIFNSLNTKILL